MNVSYPSSPLRIATRGSLLARIQANMVAESLCHHHPALASPGAIAIKVIKTSGDRFVDRPLSEIGRKGLFTREIDAAVLAGTADIAVHSMKDVPTIMSRGLMIGCLLKRGDPRDVLISREEILDLDDLPQGAQIGSSAPRRQAQLLAHRPDLHIHPLRGNIDRRLETLKTGTIDAILLALAGLHRLEKGQEQEKEAKKQVILEPEIMLPAAAQGAIGVVCRAEDQAIRNLLLPLHDRATEITVSAERSFLATLEGNCHTPIAALARIEENTLTLHGLTAKLDGSQIWRIERRGSVHKATELGWEAATRLKAQGGTPQEGIPKA